MTEDAMDLGYVLLVHGDEALKFAVKAIELPPSSHDLTREIPIAYIFQEQIEGGIHSNSHEFDIKVRDTFLGINGWRSPETHDKAIRFGLTMFAQNQQLNSFELTIEAYDNLKSKCTLHGRGLRKEILRRLFIINRKWPRETVTRFDVGDNLFADEKEIDEWLQDLREEGSLIKGTSKINKRRGHTTGGYRVSPQAYSKVEKELAETQSSNTDKPLLFLSYSTKDKAIAGKIKAELETRGFDVFLAHEDIRPSDEWKDEILKALNQCNAFLPLLTNRFRYSQWTDQEAGIALAKDKLIVPIKITRNPLGFISSKQAISFNDQDTVGSCEEIVELLNEKLNYSPA